MNDAFEQCLKCGHSLDGFGGCAICGFKCGKLENPGLLEQLKRLTKSWRRHNQKLALGDASLVNAKSADSFLLSETTTSIGRDIDNDIVLSGVMSVSRKQCKIQFVDNGYWVENVSNTNCTLLNGKRLTKRTLLAPDDMLQIGDTYLLFEVHALPEFRGYEILSTLGQCDSGVVYEALDRRKGIKVAIKHLTLRDFTVEKRKLRLARFRREGMIVRRLKHPNIVAVHDVKLDQSGYYYVMEFLAGNTLRSLLKQKNGRLTPQELLPVVEGVASALAYAHSHKVVHRDVKPDNIFVLPGDKVKLADFGVAHVDDDIYSSLTKSGSFLGTLLYSSPEQLTNARNVDYRADIFSLAVVCYEALSGVPPFNGKGVMDTVTMITREREKPLKSLVPELSDYTSDVIARAMSKEPNMRYCSVTEFAQEFRKSLSVTALYDTVS